jgi:hypothetical protein
MRTRTAIAIAAALVTAAGAMAPAVAAPKKAPIKGSYTAGPLTPDPTPIAGNVCEPATPTAIDKHTFKVPAAGVLQVDLEWQGDWALGLRDSAGDRLGESDGGTPDTVESMQVKFKRGETVTIEACNFAGAPTAKVSYTFTYKK